MRSKIYFNRTIGITALGGKSYEYDAFGNQTQYGEDDPNPFRYCGEYYDAETGLIYLRNRYYDPSTGRFLTEDPAKDGLNWYAYCGNNPVMFTDPLGLKFIPVYKSQKDKILSYIHKITGDNRYQYDTDSGHIIFNGDYNDEHKFDGGTDIGRALIRALDGQNIRVVLHEGDVTQSTGGYGRITIFEDDTNSEYITDDMLSRFVHEATHTLCNTLGIYSKLGIVYRDGLSEKDKIAYRNYIEKKYYEATALVVENYFRTEKEIGERADGRRIEPNGYGMFPKDLANAYISGDFTKPSDPYLKGNVSVFALRSYTTGLPMYLLDNYGY